MLVANLCFFALASLAVGSLDEPQSPQEPITALIVSGANNHDWEWTTPSLQGILEESGKFKVDVTYEPAKTLADAETLARYQVLVLDYNGPRWGEAAEKNFLNAVANGTGVSVIHAANNAFPGWEEYEKMVALCWRKGTGHGRFHPFDIRLEDRNHPITRDLPPIRRHPDELYHRLVRMHDAPYRVLASAYSSLGSGGTGQSEPMILIKKYGKGRVFHTPLGHVWKGVKSSRVSHQSPYFREIVVRGSEWAATGNVTPYAVSNQLSPGEARDGWTLLFDGQDPSSWRGYQKDGFPGQGWSVKDGCLHHAKGGGGGDLISVGQYRDFDFQFDWKVAEGANSGVMYRVAESAGTTWQTGPEYQVLDDGLFQKLNPKNSAGALYALYAPKNKVLKPAGEFNHGRIRLQDRRLEHWLNGIQVVSCRLGSPEWNALVEASKFKAYPGFGLQEIGHLALQDHGDEVWYRNLKIKDLSAPNPGEIELFNGRNLSGWEGYHRDGAATEDVWRVEDGILICKGSPAGYLYTQREFKNFVLSLQWRFNPVTKQAGNSGVLMRMTGEHKVWPRSIEAQLHSGNAGDFWLIGGYPAKGNESRTRGRNIRKTVGNENPVGEWNQYEITVRGGQVILRVNDQVLNEVTGAEVVPGKICLQSEGVEIQFRNIRLRPLPEK